MTLDQRAANARPHFLAAALLDESPRPKGRHREEAEAAEAEAPADEAEAPPAPEGGEERPAE
jgi:PTH1 family peptidyl-tRNA hydrolase